MNLDHDFVQVSKLSENQKKVFPKNGTLFPQIQVDTYTQMHRRSQGGGPGGPASPPIEMLPMIKMSQK